VHASSRHDYIFFLSVCTDGVASGSLSHAIMQHDRNSIHELLKVIHVAIYIIRICRIRSCVHACVRRPCVAVANDEAPEGQLTRPRQACIDVQVSVIDC
jgi:hypothetical protein